MNERKIDISIVIPAFNEEVNIVSTLEDIAVYLKASSFNYEVIIVDDGSKDKTVALADSCQHLFNNMLVLKSLRNQGKGSAVKIGILQAQGDNILFMDADNSTRINQLDKLLAFLNNGFDIAIASRRVAGAEIDKFQPILRRFLGNIYIALSKIILGTSVKDYNCGFKVFKKNAAKVLFSKITQKDWSFDSEVLFLASQNGFKIGEVPVKWQDKRTSKVKPFRDGLKSLISLFKIKINYFKGLYK